MTADKCPICGAQSGDGFKAGLVDGFMVCLVLGTVAALIAEYVL